MKQEEGIMLSAQAEYALSSQSDKTSQLSADSNLKTVDIRVRFFKHLFIACVLLLCKSPSVGAYVCKPFSTGYLQTPRKQRSSLQMYVPSSTPTSQTQAMVAKKMLGDNRNQHTKKTPPPQASGKVSRSSLRASSHTTSTFSATSPETAIASSDVLPSFRAAHGLLHPHTFMKLRDQYEHNGGGDAIRYFLDTYEEYGPMACIPCLSDPDVLPKLTEAMRAID
jgi:hypothetical protein